MDQKPKIELEDLLKLKKFEKPEPEFWETFDQGLRKKSMEALVEEHSSIWERIWERKWMQQAAIAAAFVFCGVPTYLGVESYYVENQAKENAFEVVQNQVDEQQAIDRRVAETTRELAMRKQKADSMRFVVDSFAVDPSAYQLDGDVWINGDGSWKNANRTYVNDRVKLLPQSAGVLPVNLSY
jgi:hypothetical protein